MTDHPPPADPIAQLRERFRAHLDTFYGALKLAPPYHSVEKAIVELTRAVHSLPPEEQRRLLDDPAAQWQRYKQAFIQSGLRQKHRGILMGIARQREQAPLPPEYHCLLDAVLEES